MLPPFIRKSIPVVRPLAAEALEDCARIHASAFALPWSAAEFESLYRQDSVLADAAFVRPGAPIQGFVLSRRAADEAEILTIAVDRAHRRHGLGRALMLAHMGRLSAAGVTRLFLEVESENRAAAALYRGLGFASVGERSGYYRKRDGTKATALVMRLDL